jgi:hypothetical protein
LWSRAKLSSRRALLLLAMVVAMALISISAPMKKCSYCGRENTDAATQCIECGTDEFADPVAQPARIGSPGQAQQTPDTLAPDYPKPIVVLGIWVIFLPTLFGNLSLALVALFGEFGILPGVFCFFLALGCAAICGYALYRAIKNYQIHRDRLFLEMAE